ncbi:siderophore-interacting protein, partial [Nonomuraea sp. RK-328]|nr:siderophore-interacting protein [Nonomuraea sp. RK-328]
MTEPFRMFHVRVDRLTRLSPSFLRVTFTGDDLHLFADRGFDQRIKLILPLPGDGMAHLPEGPDWFARWRGLDEERQNPMRTYTARRVRPEAGEVDVDVVVHADGGPASRWAETVRPGGVAALFGADSRHSGPRGDVVFDPPPGTGAVLLAGDETAVPAVCAILERLPAGIEGEALMEVPGDADVLDVETACAVKTVWLPRNGAARGELLVPAVMAAADRLLPPPPGSPGREAFQDVDIDAGELWEVPEEEPEARQPLYAWLAGEAALIRDLRRHLKGERGMDRRAVACMGYWRQGRAEH